MSDFNVLTSVTSLPYDPATAGEPVLFDPASKRYHVPESSKESFHLKLHGWRCATELADTAYTYARYFVKGRWPQGEDVIATDPHYAYHYAKDVIKGRWPEGEAAIATSGASSVLYAASILQGPFPQGEAEIAKSGEDSAIYAAVALKKRFRAGEPAILSGAGPESIFFYCRDALQRRWREAELVMIYDTDVRQEYADHFGLYYCPNTLRFVEK